MRVGGGKGVERGSLNFYRFQELTGIYAEMKVIFGTLYPLVKLFVWWKKSFSLVFFFFFLFFCFFVFSSFLIRSRLGLHFLLNAVDLARFTGVFISVRQYCSQYD